MIGAFSFAALPAYSACELEKIISLPASIDNGRIFVPGSIKNHPVQYLVDPAAPTLLLRSAAEAFGVYPDRLGSVAPAMIGSMEVEHNMPLAVAGSVSSFGPPQAVAILGRDALYQYDVEFDLKHNVINLFKPHDCKESNLAYWSKEYNVLDMQRNITKTINLEDERFNPFVFPHINLLVKIGGHEILAALDSGYRESNISLTAAHDLGVDRDSPGIVEVDATQELLDGYVSRTWLGKFPELSLDAEKIAPVELRFRDYRHSPAAMVRTGTKMVGWHDRAEMVLGADFLISHRVLISYSQHKVYFSYAGGPPFGTVVTKP
jgi:hypothetical protein